MSKTCQLNRPLAVDLITGPSFPWAQINQGETYARRAALADWGNFWVEEGQDTPYETQLVPETFWYAVALPTLYTTIRITRHEPMPPEGGGWTRTTLSGLAINSTDGVFPPWPDTPPDAGPEVYRRDPMPYPDMETIWFKDQPPHFWYFFAVGQTTWIRGEDEAKDFGCHVTLEPKPPV